MNALTEGGRLVGVRVAALGAAEVARRVKTSEAMARHLATGRKTPGPDLKRRLSETFGIDVETWGQPATPTPPKKPTSGKQATSETKGGPALDQLRATVEMVDEALDGLDFEAPATHRSSLLRVRVDALDKIARLQGEGELTMAMLVRSRIWRDLLSKLEPIFEKHPDAAADIADVLEMLEGP